MLSFLLLLIIVTATMSILSRGIGSGLMPSPVGEGMFGVLISSAAYAQHESVLCLIACAVWSAIAMNLGHGNAYHMGTLQTQYPDRWQTLDYLVRPITNFLGFAPRSSGYCWSFMAVKGLLIGLPLFPFGLLLTFLWPISYWISFVLLKEDSAPAEWVSGACTGIVISIFINSLPINLSVFGEWI